MPTDSADHDLTRKDPADAPRCEMERLADRMNDAPVPRWLRRHAVRTSTGDCYFRIDGLLSKTDQLDDLINFLVRVRG